MKTSPTNKKVRELISMVKEQKLLPRPEFQRRLVWSRDDKNHFIDSILRGYPFPEIYFADGDVNLETGEGTQLLVVGLQRVSTLIQYFDGDPELKLTTIAAYRDLREDDKRKFLQYDVAVRDVGAITKGDIIEVFKRLNATKYALTDIEVNNAVYAGAIKIFCERISEHEFFRSHGVFNALDYKRMGDLRYVLGLIGTMLSGYFNRDDAFEGLLDRYNDDFPNQDETLGRVTRVMDFIDECGFDQRSRVWKKADLFTLMVELDQSLNIQGTRLQPNEVLLNLSEFFASLDGVQINQESIGASYYKAALQASNDKINRLRRGVIVSELLNGTPHDEILSRLKEGSLA